MKLIAKKPCRFGGRQFYIGNEVPAELVANPTTQERLGVIAVVDAEGVPAEQSGTPLEKMFTQQDVDSIVALAIAEVEKKHNERMAEMQDSVAELSKINEMETDTVTIAVSLGSDGENEQVMAVPVKHEEIQKVFSVLQMDAEAGVKAINEVTSENVLILIHAIDSRKTIKNAAKGRADKLFPDKEDSGSENKEITGTNAEGVDT